MDAADYVLDDFDQSEQTRLNVILTQSAEALKVMLLEGLQIAMNRYQRKDRTEEP
jgi:peptidyl-tRNA hydrolase